MSMLIAATSHGSSPYPRRAFIFFTLPSSRLLMVCRLFWASALDPPSHWRAPPRGQDDRIQERSTPRLRMPQRRLRRRRHYQIAPPPCVHDPPSSLYRRRSPPLHSQTRLTRTTCRCEESRSRPVWPGAVPLSDDEALQASPPSPEHRASGC